MRGLLELLALDCPVPRFVLGPARLDPPFAVRSQAFGGPPARLGVDEIPDEPVIVQVWMQGEAWGRFFTRNPSTGVKRASAEVFQGSQTALPLMALPADGVAQLQELGDRLESHLRDAVRLDFVVANGELWLLGLRPLGRSAAAAVKIAVSLVNEGLISREEALLRVGPEELDQLMRPSFEPAEVRQASRQGRLLATGVGIGEGVATGRVAGDVATAWGLLQAGERVILVCDELTYRERDLLPVLQGVVVGGGPDSARLAAQQHEWPGVVVNDLGPVSACQTVSLGDGQIFEGALTVLPGRLSADGSTLLDWADEYRRLEVRANVSSGEEARLALALGACGVGLFRIEGLLQQNLASFQEALPALCQAVPEPLPCVAQLASALEDDLVALFLAASAPSRPPFVVRLLDAPLAPMLRYWKDHTALRPEYFQGPWENWLHELNPLQGLRCGRLSLMFPALLGLQVQAILGAWERARREGACLRVQIMMPGVCDARELHILRELVKEALDVGSMLEVPRACLRAGELAAQAEFLSFGTGDLTELTCGISRYDSPLSFLPGFLEQGILPRDPFQVIDPGVGALMEIAVLAARASQPSVQLGICGRQGAHADSVAFCHRLGLDYVSVTPAHLPAARLAAAQAALRP